ncbi:helix-turn-helix domain-containing protein [Agromyces aerolatus]|uniref:helix-turn-helix domain-containing protein n=1 Tax=Agromyces sp. LY-1074 TaxID=3074080 RepID=UPI00285DDDB8|nr:MULTISPECIES: helix-turn-helix domain-containing protein [unclassified Agromyces]MDR5699831.1 helix-turn-helix domain-containing protein [Agromyces sp. LY-1074]MDR5706357.1 helix-turn-helix domain-containing protein [Agromyces sp. LY-1358]
MTIPGSSDLGRFLTVAEAAELLSVEVTTVDGLIRSGELPAIRVGDTGPWRVELTQLQLWIQDRYEDTRRHAQWQEGEFATVLDLSAAGSPPPRLRPVD